MRALLATLTVASLLLAGCSGSSNKPSGDPGSANAPDGPPPQLHVGDHWRHESSSVGGAEVTTELEVAAIEDHGGEPAYRLEGTSDTSASGAISEVEVTSWTRVSDHANLESRSDAHLSYGGYSADSTTETVYDPPCVGLRWPLSVGAAWNSTCTSTTTARSSGANRTSTATTTTTYTVEAEERVSVPAGTFDAFRVRVQSGEQVQTQWVSWEACGMVKSEVAAQGQTVTTVLTDYRC